MAESLTGLAGRSVTWRLPESAATVKFAAALASAIPRTSAGPLVLYFDGDLGAGKTAVIRSLLASLGHVGRVPSPTYTLVEPYVVDDFRVFHVDLYRLRDPAELEDLGLVDELAAVDERGRRCLLLAEWPGRGGSRLPAPDLHLQLAIEGSGRTVQLTAHTAEGRALVHDVQGALPGGF